MDRPFLGRGDSHTEFDQLNQFLIERAGLSRQAREFVIDLAYLWELPLKLLIPSG